MADFRELDTDNDLEAGVAKFVGRDAVLAWDRANAIADYSELQAVMLDDGELVVCRAWKSGDAPVHTSVDARLSPKLVAAERMTARDMEEHGFRRPDADGVERAFAAEAGGDLVILWSSIYNEETHILARRARVGEEDSIVAGTAFAGEGKPYAEIGLDVPVSELFDGPVAEMRR